MPLWPRGKAPRTHRRIRAVAGAARTCSGEFIVLRSTRREWGRLVPVAPCHVPCLQRRDRRDRRDQALPAFFSLFAARFSFIVFSGFFFVSFLRSMPLLMVFPLSGGHGTVLRPGAKYAP